MTTETNQDNVITLADLQNILVLLDLASTRGAFRGPELQPIGQLFNKIDSFVKSATPSEDASTESSPTTTA